MMRRLMRVAVAVAILLIPIAAASQPAPPTPILFDTDIGTDIDDAYALARSLQGDPVFCAAARTWIANWLTQPDFPAAEHARAAATVQALRCPRAAGR